MKRYFLPVGYLLVFIVGLLGNMAAIFIYVLKFRPWRSSCIIMVNLSLIDFLFALNMPYLVYYYSNGDQWELGDFMCRFTRFVFFFNLYGSIMSLTCIAVFRYVVVTRPLWASRVQQKRWGIMACAVVWIIVAAELIPLRKGPHTSSPSRIRAQRVIILVLVVFVLCFLPYHILRALRIETRSMPHLSCTVRNIVHATYIISRPVAAFNTFFNLALYTLSGDTFKKAFVSVFCCQRWLRKSISLVNLAFISPAGPPVMKLQSNSSTLAVP
ncbi:hypothetical protein WMY93_022579 [Mugilogobius chulae]|uniref:G-protein coupled receptors family 1 profile domain-containing protein n=1 Tax=Mugilogobius chulae TaxID=88201 RepID=A0AAW0NHH8_9GOBI